MLQQELLQTLAEMAATIAVLSTVAGVVSRKALSPVSKSLLRDVAVMGLLVALFCLLPLIFWNDQSMATLRLCAFGAALIGFLRTVSI